jgi:hypothetical protein
MKRLVTLIVAFLFVIGCAGLTAVESDVCKDTSYYVTSPDGRTASVCPDEEYAIVRGIREENKEAGITITFMWIDFSSKAVALQYSVKNEDNMCAIFFFYDEDMSTAIGEDYREAKPYNVMGVPCEELIGEAVRQAERDSV